MTLVATERPLLAGANDSRQATWYVRDDAGGNVTPAQAVSAAIAAAPSTVDGFPYQSYRYDELASDKFDVELNYSFSNGSNGQRDVLEGEAQYSFATTLESVRINRSLGRVASYFDAVLHPNTNQARVDALFPGAVEVDGDLKPRGTTIQVPVTRFKYQYRIPEATVTLAYQVLVEELSGKVNDDLYKGREAGSVRFDGAQGTQSADGTWNMDFTFTRRLNLTNHTVGGITGIDADGWDHVWPHFAILRDEDGELNPNPSYVFVEQIYERDDLGQLGIP